MTEVRQSQNRPPRVLGEWTDPGYGRELAWLKGNIAAIHLVDDQTHVAWLLRPEHDDWAGAAWRDVLAGSSGVTADEVLRCEAFGNWDGRELAAPAEVDLLVLEGRPVAGAMMSAAEASLAYWRAAPSLP